MSLNIDLPILSKSFPAPNAELLVFGVLGGLMVSSNSCSPGVWRSCTAPVSSVMSCFSWRSCASEKRSSFERPSSANTRTLCLPYIKLVLLSFSHAVSRGGGGIRRSSVRSFAPTLVSVRSSSTIVPRSPTERASRCTFVSVLLLSSRNASLTPFGGLSSASTERSELSGRWSMFSPLRHRSTLAFGSPSSRLSISTASSRMPRVLTTSTGNM